MAACSLSASSSKLLIGLPAAALVAMVGGLLALTVVLSAASPGCDEEVGSLNGKVPERLVPIYRQAAAKFGLGERGPSILAGINWVETGFGTNLAVSSAEAEGWMQFLPESWAAFGVDGNGDGVKDPYSPWDAIFAAARLLRHSGAPGNWHDAIYSYNHAEWYVEKVEAAAKRYDGAASGSVAIAESASCAAGAPGGAVVRSAIRLFAPRAFKPLPAALWVGGGSPESVDARIWPDAVWLLENYDLRVSAAREAGHKTHGDGTAMDMVPVAGRGWDGTALRAAVDLGWIPSCGVVGSAPACPLAPAIQFIGYNGYEGHGDPAHAGLNAHLHVSWKSSEYGCPGLCEPREWVEVFPWVG
jgi:Transglycosylase SLT domain